ncbi:MAG: prepilin peptidase, partial [Nitriliruptorales bacterium]|nr:prepilin peptidase [Nitriliruptorales bacterium]
MDAAVTAACGLLGLLVGSFANVVIQRVPAGESIVSPPSACPNCGNRIAPRDNIPIASWLLLRGRCRNCKAPISPEYPIVEVLMAVVFAAVGARVGADWSLPGFLLFAWLLIVVSVIDLHTRKIPNRLTYPLTPVLLVLMAAAALASGEPGAIVRVIVGGVAGFAGLLLLALIQPKGMGMGDVKLAGFIGIALGYLSLWHVLLGIFGGFFIGGVVALVLLFTRLRDRKARIPFGPYLAAGALAALFVGQPL